MNLCDRNEIQELLRRHGFRFSKSMGQNFLIESWVPEDIAAASGADRQTGVLEIGPGIGPLTQQLARRAGKVVSVELDRRLYPVLRETMADFDNFTLLEGDAMKLPLRQTVEEQFSGLRPILCANLPYHITTPFLTACVEAQCFDSLTVLIQKEVAQRICAAPGTADYGAFTLLMQYYTQPELLFTVSNTCFLPAPKVTSAVIHCRSRKAPPVEVCSRHPPAQGAADGDRRCLRAGSLCAGRAAGAGGICPAGGCAGGGKGGVRCFARCLIPTAPSPVAWSGCGRWWC